jgi:hypothetical protein
MLNGVPCAFEPDNGIGPEEPVRKSSHTPTTNFYGVSNHMQRCGDFAIELCAI